MNRRILEGIKFGSVFQEHYWCSREAIHIQSLEWRCVFDHDRVGVGNPFAVCSMLKVLIVFMCALHSTPVKLPSVDNPEHGCLAWNRSACFSYWNNLPSWFIQHHFPKSLPTCINDTLVQVMNCGSNSDLWFYNFILPFWPSQITSCWKKLNSK